MVTLDYRKTALGKGNIIFFYFFLLLKKTNKQMTPHPHSVLGPQKCKISEMGFSETGALTQCDKKCLCEAL